jgi:gamma-glutamylcyclotransferase (GGCT)/AIG2-like uncharacterized protein YtfP
MHLFAYGTLMFPEVWRAVTGRADRGAPAHLRGFAVSRVRNGVYPVMLAAGDDAVVAGLVYRDLDAATVAALDEFESDLYNRVAVTAILASGGAIGAQAYVVPAARREHASREPWDAAAFQRECLAAYLRALAE